MFSPHPHHTGGGVDVDLLLTVSQNTGVVLQIQLTASHHLQTGQSRHHICRQIKQFRHMIQQSVLPVFSFSFHIFHPTSLYEKRV